MIELPESYVLAKQIVEVLMGKRVCHVVANQSPHKFAWYTGNPALYSSRLEGKIITGAGVYSGSVKVTASDMALLVSTPIRYYASGEKHPPKHQLLIEFEDSSAVSCTVQMWGVMFCYENGKEGEIPSGHITNDGPTPLDDGFTMEYFKGLLARASNPSLSAKAFLATEQRIPGLGNGVLQDILWTAKVHPKRKMTTISSEELLAMYDATRNVLADMVQRGGRDTERDLFGRPGGYITCLCKNTVGQPCPLCGQDIRKEAFLGGSIYYCGECQPLYT